MCCNTVPEALHSTHQDYFNACDCCQWQRVVDDAPRHCKVVQGATVQHLSSGLEPRTTVDVCTIRLKSLRNDDAGGCKHSPSRVQKLVCSVLFDCLGVLPKGERVVPIAAQHRRLQISAKWMMAKAKMAMSRSQAALRVQVVTYSPANWPFRLPGISCSSNRPLGRNRAREGPAQYHQSHQTIKMASKADDLQ